MWDAEACSVDFHLLGRDALILWGRWGCSMVSQRKHQRLLPKSQGAPQQGLPLSGQVLPCDKSEQGSGSGMWGRSVHSLL